MNWYLVGLWFGGAICGWATRGLWINYRHFNRTIRLAEDALKAEDFPRARQMMDRAKIIGEIL